MGSKNKFFIIAFVFIFIVGSLFIWFYPSETTTTSNESPTTQFTSPSLEYNGEELIDHRYINTPQKCEGYNLFMNITIEPCIAQTFTAENITHDVQFHWQGENTRNISWVFVYEGELRNGQMQVGTPHQSSKTVSYYEEEYINNFLINNVITYTDLGSPVENECDLGTVNNEQMYEVTRQTGGNQTTQNYCFDTVNPISASSFEVSGNAMIKQTEEQIFTDVVYGNKVNVEHMGSNLLGNGFNFYKVEEVSFDPDQTIYTRWTYTPRHKRIQGKWHIFGYDADLSIDEAIEQGFYIYIDPSWNNNYLEELLTVWNFEESSGPVVDAYNGTANGTNNGATRGVTGINNLAFDYDGGVPDYVDVSNNAILNQPTLTVNAWYNADVLDANNMIIAKGNRNGGDLQAFDFYLQNDGDILCTARDGSNNYLIANTGGGYAKTGEWTMITCVLDSTTNIVSVYVNGTFVVNSSSGNLDLSTSHSWRIGETQYPSSQSFDGIIDEVYVWGRRLNDTEITDLFNSGTGIFYTTPEPPTGDIYSILESPENNTITNEVSLNFTVNNSAVGIFDLVNTTLYIWNSSDDLINETTYTLSGNGSQIISFNNTPITIEDTYDWNNYICTTNGTGKVCNFSNNGNFSFTLDTTEPVITNIDNISDSIITSSDLPIGVQLNYSVSDANLDTCFYHTNENSTNQTITCNSNYTVNILTSGEKVIYAFVNDSSGYETNTSVSFDVGIYGAWQQYDEIGEGQTGNYYLQINKTSIESQTLNATLTLNNTEYVYSDLDLGTNTVLFTTSVNIPQGWGNDTGNAIFWNYSFSVNDDNYTTNSVSQDVLAITLDDCSSYTEQILNFTLYNENTRQLVNASAGSSIEVDITLTSRTDSNFSLEYSNTWTNENQALVCSPSGIINESEYRIDVVSEYGGTGYATEFFYVDNGTLDVTQNINSLTTRTVALYSLPLTDSTTFLFNFQDEDNLEVPEAIVHVFRQYIGDGEFEEVERGKQDNNGETHIHLIEEDVIYYFIVSLDSRIIYTSTNYNAKCLSEPCSIELTANPDFEPFPDDFDLMPNGNYNVSSNITTRNINLAFTSSEVVTMNLTLYKQDYTGDISIINQTSATGTSGTLTVNAPLSAGNVTYYAVVYRNNNWIATEYIDFVDNFDIYSATGTVMGFLLVGVLILMGASEGIVMGIFIILALVIVSALALINIPKGALIGFIALIGVLMWKASKISRRTQ